MSRSRQHYRGCWISRTVSFVENMAKYQCCWAIVKIGGGKTGESWQCVGTIVSKHAMSIRGSREGAPHSEPSYHVTGSWTCAPFRDMHSRHYTIVREMGRSSSKTMQMLSCLRLIYRTATWLWLDRLPSHRLQALSQPKRPCPDTVTAEFRMLTQS